MPEKDALWVFLLLNEMEINVWFLNDVQASDQIVCIWIINFYSVCNVS